MDDSYDEKLEGNLRLRATTDPVSPLVNHFFAGYDRAFILPDEREEIEGFRNCLALNATLPTLFGRRHREFVLTVDDEDGALLGGANFLATGMTAAGGPPVSVALNYVFVERASRGRGLARTLVGAVASVANRSLLGGGEQPAPAIFIEQNDPLKLSSDDYAADSARSGLDQIDRLGIWARMGARIVDFDYVQPALSADQDSDDGLIYAALQFPVPAVPADYLHDHLQSFFGVSVRKGESIADDADAWGQLEALSAQRGAVALLDMGAAIEALRAEGAAHARSFRDLAKGLV